MKYPANFFSLLLTALIFISIQIFSQVPDTMWTKTFGGSNIDVGYCVQQTADSGYIISGYTRSYGTMSGRNVWLIKTDRYGNEQWNNTFGGADDEEGYSVRQTNDGGYIIAGYTKSFGAGGTDVFLIKTDSAGNQSWIGSYGGSSDDEGYAVLQTADGNYIIAGETESFGAGGKDVWLIKTNSSGNIIWQKTHGGMGSDGAWSVQQTTDGGYVLTGWTYSYGPGYMGNVWLVKTDSLGDQEWNNYFGGTDVDRGYSVQQTTDGGYIITGYTDSYGAGLYDMLLIKTDRQGAEEWMKTFGGSGRDYGNRVQQTADGGYIVVGYTLSFGAGGDDVYLVKTDMYGNEEWSNTYGGTYSDVGYCVRQTIDGGYIITGHTLSFGAGVHDVWLIKLDNSVPVELISFTASVNGDDVRLVWGTATETNNQGFEIQRKADNSEWNIIGFLNGAGTTTEPQNYSFADNIREITAALISYRLKQIDFDGSVEYSEEVTVTNFTSLKFNLEQNYPNPFNPLTTIQYKIPLLGGDERGGLVTLKVYNILGREIETLVNDLKEPGAYEATWNAANISSGIYFYRLQAGEYKETKKMLLIK